MSGYAYKGKQPTRGPGRPPKPRKPTNAEVEAHAKAKFDYFRNAESKINGGPAQEEEAP